MHKSFSSKGSIEGQGGKKKVLSFWDKRLKNKKQKTNNMVLSLLAGRDALKAATKMRCQRENEEAPSYTGNF